MTGQEPPAGEDRITRQIQEARRLLTQLNFDAERSNERSALILLALLGLTPDTAWADATNPRLRTVEIMEWLRTHYDRDYKPNTRETIRRRTLHQFADALLVEQNPDEPTRPINSYLVEVPGLREIYARARDLRRIAVTFPDGRAVTLSPGGQNVLLKLMVEDFCGYFTPGGQVLYIGDADTKWAVFEQEALAALGVTPGRHGKMPDLVVYLPDKNWLVLMEAASWHGPVDAKRYGELATLFAASTAGLVYVSCFPSREEMRQYISQIAWETEVWCADHPTHLIHFNGERFLGPYGQE